MNDEPAIEAAIRAVPTEVSTWVGPGRFALRGAREALKPIRELHYPVTCASLADGRHKTVCAHCHRRGFYTTAPESGDWPCDTARLVYSADELGVLS